MGQLQSIQDYIRQSWRVLTRSHAKLADAAVDLKSPPPLSGRWPLYISRKESLEKIVQDLRSDMTPADFDRIDIRPLPANLDDIREHGLLYLPHSYVVPGGRFNEMYGWDSYFIQAGLLRDNELQMAKTWLITSSTKSSTMARSSMPTALTISLGHSRRS